MKIIWNGNPNDCITIVRINKSSEQMIYYDSYQVLKLCKFYKLKLSNSNMNIRVDFYIILIVLCTIIDLFSKVILLKRTFLFLENTQKKKRWRSWCSSGRYIIYKRGKVLKLENHLEWKSKWLYNYRRDK